MIRKNAMPSSGFWECLVISQAIIFTAEAVGAEPSGIEFPETSAASDDDEALWEIRDPEVVGKYGSLDTGNTFSSDYSYTFAEDGRYVYEENLTKFPEFPWEDDTYSSTHIKIKGEWRTGGDTHYIRTWKFAGIGNAEHVETEYKSWKYKVTDYGIELNGKEEIRNYR